MASPMSVLSRTLQNISLSKIRELDSRRNSYESRKRDFLDKAHAASDPRDRLSYLLGGYRELGGSKSYSDPSLSNIDRWLDQSRYDASIPESKLVDFDHQLHAKLDVQSRKLDMAHLYSRLLTEWMEQSSDTSSFEVVEGHSERLSELVAKFEAVVFEPLETNEDRIREFLDRFFPDEQSQKSLQGLRERIAESTNSLMSETSPFNRDSISSCIKGLLTEDIIGDEKRAILQNFLESDIAKDEIADVLNMRYADLDRWQWNAGEHGIPVMPRAGLNGKYRIWADDDILQMLFVQYIGIKLSAIVKSNLTEFMTEVYTRGGKDGHRVPSKRDKDRQRYYLNSYEKPGVEAFRKNTFLETFFLSQLPSSETSLFDGEQQYDNDNDSSDDDDSEDGWGETKQPKKRLNIRQELLRQLTADIFVTRLRGVTHDSPKEASGPVVVVQTDLQWFGTSIPHSTAYAVMRYVGFTERWIDFFTKYLQAPLNLDSASDDRPQLGPRTRKRGVPMAHASEKLIGELMLFFMDVAVNRETGILLYRLHDDIWFCDEPDASARAWACMHEYAEVFGLEFNRKKTGSVYLPGSFQDRDPRITKALPAGSVTVGFLCLDPESGKWVIDQGRVNAHVDQLEKQLRDCRSVLAWVQTWNSCIGRFFSHTFGEPAFCLGTEHLDSVLDTYSRILKRLFPSGSVTEHVKTLIQTRFNLPSSSSLPDAFIYLPEALGGLGLRNPFVPLFLVRKNILDKSPSSILRDFLDQEHREYLDHKARFDDHNNNNKFKPKPILIIHPSEVHTFPPLSEFAHFREHTSDKLLHAYKFQLLNVPAKEEIKLSWPVLDALRDALGPSSSWEAPARGQSRRGRGGGRGGGRMGRQVSGGGGADKGVGPLTLENKWFIALYADELMERFGGLSLVDKQFLPGGVLSMMRERKVTWQMVL